VPGGSVDGGLVHAERFPGTVSWYPSINACTFPASARDTRVVCRHRARAPERRPHLLELMGVLMVRVAILTFTFHQQSRKP